MLFAAAFGIASVAAARADGLRPMEGKSIDLGGISGIAYYTVERDGFHVVATLAQGEAGTPIRVVSVLAAWSARRSLNTATSRCDRDQPERRQRTRSQGELGLELNSTRTSAVVERNVTRRLACPPSTFSGRPQATPEQYVAGLTDFGPGRSKLFGNSADAYLKVHHRGGSHADVTEGSGGIWERLHYDWSDPNRVVLTTTDSNVWGGASGHIYTFTRQPDGTTDIDVVVIRDGKNLTGRLLGFRARTIGRRVLEKAFENSVKAIEARNSKAEGPGRRSFKHRSLSSGVEGETSKKRPSPTVKPEEVDMTMVQVSRRGCNQSPAGPTVS
jgi:hypothetical protein